MSDLNSVALTGTVMRDPITRFSDSGAMQVTFHLSCSDVSTSGATFNVFVPIETYGQAADAAGALQAGDTVLISGKLKWVSWLAKDGTKRSSLCVLARLVRPLVPVGQAVAP